MYQTSLCMAELGSTGIDSFVATTSVDPFSHHSGVLSHRCDVTPIVISDISSSKTFADRACLFLSELGRAPTSWCSSSSCSSRVCMEHLIEAVQPYGMLTAGALFGAGWWCWCDVRCNGYCPCRCLRTCCCQKLTQQLGGLAQHLRPNVQQHQCTPSLSLQP